MTTQIFRTDSKLDFVLKGKPHPYSLEEGRKRFPFTERRQRSAILVR
jgi:hypothetical protein